MIGHVSVDGLVASILCAELIVIFSRPQEANSWHYDTIAVLISAVALVASTTRMFAPESVANGRIATCFFIAVQLAEIGRAHV